MSHNSYVAAPLMPNSDSASLAELVNFSPDDRGVALTLAAAAPALDMVNLREEYASDSEGLYEGKEIVVAESPYEKVMGVRIRSEDTYNAAGYVGYFDSDTIWAETAAEIDPKIARWQAIETAKEELVTTHALGKGALLIANEFGGIDVENPDATARHLVVRAIIAGEAQLKTVKDLAKVGLVHPLLGEMMPDDIAELMDNMSKIIEVVGLIPDNVRASTAPALLNGAVEQGRIFVETHKDEILLAATVTSDPMLAAKILKLLPGAKNLSMFSSSSGLNTELAKHAFKLLNR